jgi:hypothetical protein
LSLRSRKTSQRLHWHRLAVSLLEQRCTLLVTAIALELGLIRCLRNFIDVPYALRRLAARAGGEVMRTKKDPIREDRIRTKRPSTAYGGAWRDHVWSNDAIWPVYASVGCPSGLGIELLAAARYRQPEEGSSYRSGTKTQAGRGPWITPHLLRSASSRQPSVSWPLFSSRSSVSETLRRLRHSPLASPRHLSL